jgi:hypothetical protein
MRPVLLLPGSERLVVHSGVCAVVESSRENVLNSLVETLTTLKGSGVLANLLPDQNIRLVSTEATSSVREDLRKELGEQVESLKDSSTTVGRHVNDQLRLVLSNSLVDQVGVHCLEVLLTGRASDE